MRKSWIMATAALIAPLLAGCSGSANPQAVPEPAGSQVASEPSTLTVLTPPAPRTPDGPDRPKGMREAGVRTSHERAAFSAKSGRELAEQAGVVVVGTIMGERRGPVDDSQGPDLRLQWRLLDLKVEQALSGARVSREYEVHELGWWQYKNRTGVVEESRAVLAEHEPNIVGKRGIFVLRQRADGKWKIHNHQSVFYIANDGSVEDSRRHDQLVRSIEAMTETEAQAAFRGTE